MRKYLKFIILSLLAAFFLWWFGRDLDWAGVRAAVGQSDWRLITVAVAVVCVTYLLRAYRWRALLAPLAQASLRELFAATTVGFGAVFLVGRAGEVVRPAFLPLRDQRVRPSASFVTIAVERIYDMVAVVVLFAANLLWFRAPGGDAGAYGRIRNAGIIMLVAAVCGIAGLVWFRHHSHGFINWLDAKSSRAPSILNRAGHFIAHLLEQVARALSVLVDARELAITVGWTILLWVTIILADWLVLRAFGLPFGWSETVFVMGFGLVGSLVPTPGGAAGTFHAAMVTSLTKFLNVPPETAWASAIVLHLVVFGPALIFGLYFFLRSHVQLTRLQRLISSETMEEEIINDIKPRLHNETGTRGGPHETNAIEI